MSYKAPQKIPAIIIQQNSIGRRQICRRFFTALKDHTGFDFPGIGSNERVIDFSYTRYHAFSAKNRVKGLPFLF